MGFRAGGFFFLLSLTPLPLALPLVPDLPLTCPIVQYGDGFAGLRTLARIQTTACKQANTGIKTGKKNFASL